MKTSNEMKNEYRKKVAEQFIKGLEEQGLAWKRGWAVSSMLPMNGRSNTYYKGINKFYLLLVQLGEKYNDNRWYTFKQIKEGGYRLKKGSKHEKVEYWYPYNMTDKKKASWDEYYNNFNKPLDEQKKIILLTKYFQVFNGQQIEGLPEREVFFNDKIHPSDLIKKISDGLEVPIVNEEQPQAYYDPLRDSITLPPMERFYSQEEYNHVGLHELAHSTGAPHRLNRELDINGTENYAKEELVAEITSAFMSIHFDFDVTESPMMDSHKAYINSWIQEIKSDPDVLYKAVRKAEEAADYMEKKAGLKIDNELSIPPDLPEKTRKVSAPARRR